MGGGTSWSAKVREFVKAMVNGEITATIARKLPKNTISYDFTDIDIQVHIHFSDSAMNEIVAAHIKPTTGEDIDYKLSNYEASMIDSYNQHLL